MSFQICDKTMKKQNDDQTMKKVTYSIQEIKVASDIEFLNLNLCEPSLFMSYKIYMLKCPINFKLHRPVFVRRSEYGVHVRDISNFDQEIIGMVLFKLSRTCWNFTSTFMKLAHNVIYEDKEEKLVKLKIVIKGYKVDHMQLPSLVMRVVDIC